MSKAVVHLITGLGKGGAETMLYQILKYRTDPEFRHKVVSLGAAHYYEDLMRGLGCDVVVLNLHRHPISTFSLPLPRGQRSGYAVLLDVSCESDRIPGGAQGRC